MKQNINGYVVFDIYDANGHRIQKVPLKSMPISIGRDPSSDLYIVGTYVSSQHGQFYLQDNKLMYKDCSKNGTYLWDKPIHQLSDKSTVLRQNDGLLLAGREQNRYRDFPYIYIKELEYQSTTPMARPHGNRNTTPLNQEFETPHLGNVTIIKDKNNKPIQLKDTHHTYDLDKLGEGGTATVYQFDQHGKHKVVKIYHDEIIAKHRTEYQHKLQAMLDSKPDGTSIIVDGEEYTQFVWPESLVYDNGKLVGYVMQALPKSDICQLNSYISNIAKLDTNHHSITYRIQVARNLAIAVHNLHKAGHYFIDVKPENIFVFKDKCTVCFIDCDGFSIQQGAYPAKHYSKGYQAPFVLQNKLKPLDLSNEPYQDYYCLAHLIFEILDFGNKPFTGSPKSQALIDALMNISGDSSYDYKVETGLYPYHLQTRDDIAPFKKSTYQYWPASLRQLFDQAFTSAKDDIPTAMAWAKELNTHIKNQSFEKCQAKPNDSLHHHFKGTRCPICDVSNTATNPNLDTNRNMSMPNLSTYSVSSPSLTGNISKAHSVISNHVSSAYYDEVGDFYEGLAKVKKNGKWGFINRSRCEIVSPKYDFVSDFSDKLARVRLGNKFGFINKEGREITGLRFDGLYDFQEGLAVAKIGQKWGFIDRVGKLVIDCQYDDASAFVNGKAKVRKGATWHVIDKKNKTVK